MNHQPSFPKNQLEPLLLLVGLALQLSALGTALLRSESLAATPIRCALVVLAMAVLSARLPKKNNDNRALWMALLISTIVTQLSVEHSLLFTSMSWATFVLAGLRCAHRSFGSTSPLLLFILACLCAPLEDAYRNILDPYIQFSTTFYAAPLITWTGLPVEIRLTEDPYLLSKNLEIYVTPLCAGLHTFINLISLSTILAVFFIPGHFNQLLYALISLVFGFIMNTLRIVISSHAANQLLDFGNYWDIAHDLIGYGMFVVTYGCMFFLAKKLASPKPSKAELPAIKRLQGDL